MVSSAHGALAPLVSFIPESGSSCPDPRGAWRCCPCRCLPRRAPLAQNHLLLLLRDVLVGVEVDEHPAAGCAVPQSCSIVVMKSSPVTSDSPEAQQLQDEGLGGARRASCRTSESRPRRCPGWRLRLLASNNWPTFIVGDNLEPGDEGGVLFSPVSRSCPPARRPDPAALLMKSPLKRPWLLQPSRRCCGLACGPCC